MPEQRQRYFILAFNLFTVFYLGMICVEFLTKGEWTAPGALADLYLLILVYVAGDKEIRRWRKKYVARNRHGEIFVISWSFLTVAILAVELLGGAKAGYRMPHDLPLVEGGVLAIYIITEYLKAEFRK
jgi:hypothetical protein